MKILVLEDDPVRHISFRKNLADHDLDIVTTSKEAIQKLQDDELYDALFLDHDLGGKVMVASGDGTGYEVAKWLESNPFAKPEKIYLHTMNPVGQQNMKQALPEAIIAPFLTLFK